MRIRALLAMLATSVILLGACAASTAPPPTKTTTPAPSPAPAEAPASATAPAPALSPPESLPEAPSISVPVTPTAPTTTPAIPKLSAQIASEIAGINIAETTALTSLFRISDELDKVRSDGSLSEEEEAELRAGFMAKFNNWINARGERLGLNSLSPIPASEQIVWTKPERDLLEGAAERIELYRKGDATILVVDATGKPVADTVVSMDMLKHDFLFGANLFMLEPSQYTLQQLTSTYTPELKQAYGDAFATLFNYAVLGFYWPDYEWTRGREQQASLTSMANWASDRGTTVKGHPLVWPCIGVPGWAAQLSPEQLDEVQQERVARIVEQFRGLIDCWDVVNEATDVGSYQEPLGSWMLAYTPAGATARALAWARASNQEATLLVNDWRIDEEYHDLLEDVIAASAQFDAVGIQSHMHKGTWTLEEVGDTCERFKDFNVPLHFTEVTVLSGDLKTDDDYFSYHPGWDTKPEGETYQAEYVAALYTILFSHPSVQAITWWDLSDLGAWQGAPAGLIRKDMSPKPAYERLMQLIHQDWWTNAEANINTEGTAVLRGFYGQYLLTIKSGTHSVKKLIHLKADQDNIFEVQLP